MPSFNGGGFGDTLNSVKNAVLAPERRLLLIIACIVVFIVVIIILVDVTTKKSSKFNQQDLDKPLYDRHKLLDSTCSLSDQPVPPSSDKQSHDMVTRAMHRSKTHMDKMNNEKSHSSANKAAKLSFGLNTYNELTTYE